MRERMHISSSKSHMHANFNQDNRKLMYLLLTRHLVLAYSLWWICLPSSMWTCKNDQAHAHSFRYNTIKMGSKNWGHKGKVLTNSIQGTSPLRTAEIPSSMRICRLCAVPWGEKKEGKWRAKKSRCRKLYTAKNMDK